MDGSPARAAALAGEPASGAAWTRAFPNASASSRHQYEDPIEGSCSANQEVAMSATGVHDTSHDASVERVYRSFLYFTDPDGNTWLVQEVTTRLWSAPRPDKRR